MTTSPKKRKWIELVDETGRSVGGSAVPIELEDDDDEADAVVAGTKKQYADSHLHGISPTLLNVFKDRTAFNERNALALDVSITNMGDTKDDPIIVQRPRLPTPAAAVFGTPSVLALPQMTPLANAAALTNDCIDLPAWSAGSTIAIPQIHAIMQPLGGCTSTGRLYWREEEKQVALILLTELLGTSLHPTRTSILMGSPGAGKSTVLCVLAFYVALVGKKNVLVVRRLHETSRSYCVFCLRHKGDGHVEWFSAELSDEEEACAIYNTLDPNVDSPSFYLMLDGFVYDQIPMGLSTFYFLATSDAVDLKSSESEYAYCCLLPSWRRDDLFRLGRSLYNWTEDKMTKRFYYSGGSVRDFTKTSIEDIRINTSFAMTKVVDASFFRPSAALVRSIVRQSGRLSRPFVKPEHVSSSMAYEDCLLWQHIVDSEYAVALLRDYLGPTCPIGN